MHIVIIIKLSHSFFLRNQYIFF